MKNKLSKNEKLKVKFDYYLELKSVNKLTDDQYYENFNSFKKLYSKNLPYIYDINNISDLLSCSQKKVTFLLLNKDKAYSTFNIPKKSGSKREINAPSKIIKRLQRWVLNNILYNLNTGDHSHGFVLDRSIYSNANLHVNQDLILGIDIKDFFPSISFGNVYHIFKSAGYTKKVSWSLSNLCTYHGKLPQGAPTSPMLANLATVKLDNIIAKYCSRRGFNYSRYADDITISGSYNLPMHTHKIIDIVKENGFVVNDDKTRMFSKGSKQKVTGLVVNDKVSIGRKKKKKLRAIVHNVLMNGPIVENRANDPFFREKLFGHLGHANSIDSNFAGPLISELKNIDWSEYNEYIKDIWQNEINKNQIKRMPRTFLVEFDELDVFCDISDVPFRISSNDLTKQLDNLKEKCEFHGLKECRDCLYQNKDVYKKCMKYILGHYTRTTGNHHHSHEIYDMKVYTNHNGVKIAVAFLMKADSGNRNTENSLFRQFFSCTGSIGIDLIAIVCNFNLKNQMCEDLGKLIRMHNKGNNGNGELQENYYCLILRNEMRRILFDFNNKFN